MEDQHHVLFCDSPQAKEQQPNNMDMLSDQLQQIKTHPDITTLINIIAKGGDIQNINLHDYISNFQMIINEKGSIGQLNFLLSVWSMKWKQVQKYITLRDN